MSHEYIINYDPDTSSSRREDREKLVEKWSRDHGLALAEQEGIELTGLHWEIIVFLRDRYVEKGDPESAREVAEELEAIYQADGGQRLLRRLFSKGPVTQGCRIAGLPVPAYSVDPSFGTAY